MLEKAGIPNLVVIISRYFERLLLPEQFNSVVYEFQNVFYKNMEKTENFVKTLNRIIWEYNYVNKMFIEAYK